MKRQQKSDLKRGRIHSAKSIHARRAPYHGAKKHLENLIDQKAELSENIASGRVIISDSDNGNRGISRPLTSAQIADYRRRLEMVKNEILLTKNDFRDKEFEFKSVVRKNTRVLRDVRFGIKEELEARKLENMKKMLNSNVAKISEDLTSIKSTFPTNAKADGKQLKSALLKLIRKVNNGVPITNISMDIVAELYNGISKWDNTNNKIWEQ